MQSTRRPGKIRTLCWPARDFSLCQDDDREDGSAMARSRFGSALVPIIKPGVDEEDEKIRRTTLRYIDGNDRRHIIYCLCGHE